MFTSCKHTPVCHNSGEKMQWWKEIMISWWWWSNLNPGRHHVPVLQPGQALLPQRLPHLFVKVQFRFRCFSLKSLHSSIFGSLVSVLSSYYNRSCDIAEKVWLEDLLNSDTDFQSLPGRVIFQFGKKTEYLATKVWCYDHLRHHTASLLY